MGCTNTLAIGRPTQEQIQAMACSATYKGTTDVSPCNRPGLGPRPKREKVREEIRDYILHMLGAPAIRLELDEQNIDFCINQALKIVEDYAPTDYFSYYTFITTPGKSVYELPPDVGYVRSVEYKQVPRFSFKASDLDGAIPVEYFYPGGTYASIQGGLIDPIQPIWGRAGEWILYKQYERMYSRVSSNEGGWEWIGGYRHIKLYPVPCAPQRVGVHYLPKCKDWEEVTQAMQEGSLTYAKEILGRVRGRIKNPPGPGGGIQLDGAELLQEAREDRKQWFEDLIYKFGEAGAMPIRFG
ncbi:MAG: hypothetical protein DWQ19_11735 [Crenarchaeota archaeon]|nr:MAG: hypothetical protein DWQ19_11735 [Thermoproteota archaeon]